MRLRKGSMFARAVCALGVLGWALLTASRSAAQPVSCDGEHIPTPDLSQGGGFRGGDLIVQPISHATMVLCWSETVIYVDPVGGADAFEDSPAPDLVLLTDIHGDHFDVDTLNSVITEDTVLIAPRAVAEQLPDALADRTTVLHSDGDSYALFGIGVKTVPMYNTTKERLQYHEKGRGNGYIVTFGATRIYIAGDTEDTPEMRNLRDIDAAFVPMNLPYTMTVEQAADAVLEFRPSVVYPYHYRGSDVERFESLVESQSDIDVRLLDWYDD